MKTDKSRIVDYIVVNLSKKAVKAVDFCNAAGLPINTVSRMKNPGYHSKIGEAMWEFLSYVYLISAFDIVMKGQVKYEGVRKKPEKKAEITTEQKEEPKTEPKETVIPDEEWEDIRENTREAPETKVVPDDEWEALAGLSDLSDAMYKPSHFGVKTEREAHPSEQPTESRVTNINVQELEQAVTRSAGALLNSSEISLGTAIDALLKHGARFNIQIELSNSEPASIK